MHYDRISVCFMRTKSEHEEHYHLVMKRLNCFDMIPHESVNRMIPSAEPSWRARPAWLRARASLARPAQPTRLAPAWLRLHVSFPSHIKLFKPTISHSIKY
jgi:hypothetical protein